MVRSRFSTNRVERVVFSVEDILSPVHEWAEFHCGDEFVSISVWDCVISCLLSASHEYTRFCRILTADIANFDIRRGLDIVLCDRTLPVSDLLRFLEEGYKRRFVQDEDFRKYLLSTAGEVLLFYHTSPVWGTGRDWSGKNLLGKMLVHLRDSGVDKQEKPGIAATESSVDA